MLQTSTTRISFINGYDFCNRDDAANWRFNYLLQAKQKVDNKKAHRLAGLI